MLNGITYMTLDCKRELSLTQKSDIHKKKRYNLFLFTIFIYFFSYVSFIIIFFTSKVKKKDNNVLTIHWLLKEKDSLVRQRDLLYIQGLTSLFCYQALRCPIFIQGSCCFILFYFFKGGKATPQCPFMRM